MPEKFINVQASQSWFTYISDLELASQINKDKAFCPPDMEKHLINLQQASGRDFSSLILIASNALFFMSGDRHAKLRKKILQTMGKTPIEKWIPVFEKIIEKAVNQLTNSHEPDIVADFTYPIFSETTQAVLGIEPGDAEKFDYWTQQLQEVLQPLLPIRELVKMEAGFKDLLNNLRIKAESEEHMPLIQELMHFEMDSFTKNDAIATILVLYGASITLSQTLANIVWNLLAAPEIIREQVQNPAWVRNNMDYLIKIGASQRYITSVCMESKTVGNQQLNRGDNVIIDLLEVHSSGCPYLQNNQWGLDELADNNHIAFGKGNHFCVGAFQTKLIIERALPALFKQFPRMAMLSKKPHQQPHKQAVMLKSLKVSLNNI